MTDFSVGSVIQVVTAKRTGFVGSQWRVVSAYTEDHLVVATPVNELAKQLAADHNYARNEWRGASLRGCGFFRVPDYFTFKVVHGGLFDVEDA